MTEEWLEWYAPNKIVYSRPQMWFLLCHMDILHDGIYPPDPSGSAPTDCRNAFMAPFVPAVEHYTEVRVRLDNHRYGQSLLREVCEVDSHSYLSPKDKASGLTWESQTALTFISGWRRKAKGA